MITRPYSALGGNAIKKTLVILFALVVLLASVVPASAGQGNQTELRFSEILSIDPSARTIQVFIYCDPQGICIAWDIFVTKDASISIPEVTGSDEFEDLKAGQYIRYQYDEKIPAITGIFVLAEPPVTGLP